MRLPAAFRCTLLVLYTSAALAMVQALAQTASAQQCPTITYNDPNSPPYEFRAFFVPTAYNLGWPSRSGLHWRAQADEIDEIVALAKNLNCNVIILQVRAFGDRIHRGTTLPIAEPWSAALSHGNDPDKSNPPKYDPLGMWIKKCHAKGIELHAWVNPFRVDGYVFVDGKPLPVVPTQDGRHMYLYPYDQSVQTYVIRVIQDLLNYRAPIAQNVSQPATTFRDRQEDGIDGVLFDHDLPDPDRSGITQSASTTPSTAPDSGTQQAPALRATVDSFIQTVFEKVHDGQHLKFGISPSWNDTKAKGWLANRKINYAVPELYFKRDSSGQFKKRLEEWLEQIPPPNGFKPVVVAGLSTLRAQSPENDADDPWPAQEIEDQICDARRPHSNDPNLSARGQAHYSWSPLRAANHGGPSEDKNVGKHLKKTHLYAYPALVPQCTLAPDTALEKPTVTLSTGVANWQAASNQDKVFLWAVWRHVKGGDWENMEIVPFTAAATLEVGNTIDKVAVRAVDYYGQVSAVGTNP